MSETKPSPEAQASEEAKGLAGCPLCKGAGIRSTYTGMLGHVARMVPCEVCEWARERERLALERAAKVADKATDKWRGRHIASAIRALIPGQEPTAGRGKEGADGEK